MGDDPTERRFYQRKTPQSKSQARTSEDRPTTASKSTDRLDHNTNVLPSLATTFRFADVISSSHKASPESLAFAKLIHAVKQDISETTRLSLAPIVSTSLDANPNKKAWINRTLLDVRRALNDIGIDTDAAHPEGESDLVASRSRYEWVLSHQKRLLRKQQQLQTCHHNLAGAIHLMQTIELYPQSHAILQSPIFEAPIRPWLPGDEKNALRGPYSRQKFRASQNNLSSSSVALSGSEHGVDQGMLDVSLELCKRC